MFKTNLKKGITLVELMVVCALVSIGIIGLVSSFKYLNWGIQTAKGRSLANNLAQEKIEVLKNKSYYRILVTTATTTDTNFSPSLIYDKSPNGVENVNVGGVDFERRVYIRKVSEDASGNLTYLDWDDSDPGLKEILVYVIWKEGSTWKKVELRNLRENPDRISLSATFTGNVQESGVNVEGVTVKAQENPARYDITDSDGNYSFAIEPGSYTLKATKTGYFSKTSSVLSINKDETYGYNFSLIQMSTGTITGTVWLNDHLVISQVVGSTASAGWNQEYVEVFNPTTWTWTVNGEIGLKYQRIYDDYKKIIEISYITNSIQPKGFYLFANTGTVTAGGVERMADAVWSDSNTIINFPDFANQKNIIRVFDEGGDEGGGAIEIYRISDGIILDQVGWNRNNGVSGKQTAPFYETSPISQDIGLQKEEQYVRFASTSGMNSSYGPSYDTNNNDANFGEYNPIFIAPSNSIVTKTIISATPAYGAIVYADDGLSISTYAYLTGDPPYAEFKLIDVATGSWTIYASSGMLYLSSGTFGGTTQGFTSSAENLYFTSTTIYGYISGKVTDISANPLSGIIIYGEGPQTTTDTNGNYLLPVESVQSITVKANYQNSNPNYVETSSAGISVQLGEITKGVDFVLCAGGKLRGWVTTNGVDALPNIPVVVFKTGVAQVEGVSGSDGYFDISNLSTGTYVIIPQLDLGETSIPESSTKTISQGDQIFVGTFTVSGAMGYVSGTVTSGGASITTGVLIYATTTTITSDPPTIDSTLRSGSNIYYAVSSNAKGQYSLAVRGGYTYNIYAWWTTWGGETPSTVRKSYTGVSVSAGQTVTRNFSW